MGNLFPFLSLSLQLKLSTHGIPVSKSLLVALSLITPLLLPPLLLFPLSSPASGTTGALLLYPSSPVQSLHACDHALVEKVRVQLLLAARRTSGNSHGWCSSGRSRKRRRWRPPAHRLEDWGVREVHLGLDLLPPVWPQDRPKAGMLPSPHKHVRSGATLLGFVVDVLLILMSVFVCVTNWRCMHVRTGWGCRPGWSSTRQTRSWSSTCRRRSGLVPRRRRRTRWSTSSYPPLRGRMASATPILRNCQVN